MLSIAPWIAANGGATLDEVCQRFDIERRQLLDDLDTLSLVGIPPYSPDLLVEVVVEDDRVWIHLPQAFDKPLRLTPEQGLALLAAGTTVLAMPGTDPSGPLARALEKIASIFGVEPGEDLDIRLGDAGEATLTLLRDAIAQRRLVELDYYAYSRDERRHRVIEPHRLYADHGQWYVAAHCRTAGGERTFRVDRIAGARLLEESFTPPTSPPPIEPFRADEADPRVVLELDRSARWVAEYYPLEGTRELDNDRMQVTLAVSAIPWLERLLLQLGPAARVVQADAGLERVGRAAAERVLARYRGKDGGSG